MAVVLSQFEERAEAEAIKLSVMVVCEDLAAWRRAKNFFDQLSMRLGTATRVDRNFWRVNLLRTPLLQEQAAVEASRADLIVLSLDSRTGMSEDVKKWMGRWLDHKENRAYCLGVLQDYDLEDANQSRPVTEYMERMAVTAGTAFFSCNTQMEDDVANTLTTLVKFRGQPSSAGGLALRHPGQSPRKEGQDND